jgi:hypothetical protein
MMAMRKAASDTGYGYEGQSVCCFSLNSTQGNNQLYHNHRVGNFRLIRIQIKVQVGKQSGENGAGLRAAEEENIIDRNSVGYRIIGTRLQHLTFE